MAGLIVFMLVCLGISIHTWRLVFNESARQKLAARRWTPFKLSKEQREMDDAGALAGILIAAIVSGFLFVTLLILGIVQLFHQS